MSDRLDIPSGEHGLIRVFTLDLSLTEAEPLLDNDAQGLKSLTGATALDTDHIDLFDMNDLSGMPLADYLAEGHGVPHIEIAPHRAQLDRVKGRVLVMRSPAFEHLGQRLQVSKPLRWIATFGEAQGEQPIETLRSPSAVGVVPPAQAAAPPHVPTGRSPAWIIALIIAVALAGVLLTGWN